MIKHSLDIERSRAVYNNCKPLMQIKMCYNNVFNVVTEYINKFRSGEWKVTYSYVETMAGVYCRHC